MRGLVKIALALVLSVAAGRAVYVAADPEKRDIDQAVRASAPGQFVRLSDGYTHYDVGGPPDGPVVVLAAGVSVPYYIWDPTFAALVGAGFRVLRYDYYGRGYSDRPDMPYTQDAYVRQLTQLLDAQHITQPIDLAGLSFGGSVVTSFADRYPDRVRSLVYIDPSFRTPYSVGFLVRRAGLWDALTAVFEERWWADRQLEDFYHPERFPDWPDRYAVQIQYRGFRRAQRSTVVSNATEDQGPQLKRVGAHARPVLAFWGKEDTAVPLEFSATLLEAMPHARLVAVESAGHLPHWEQPAIVHPALIAFLRQTEQAQ
ncbi:MAG: alpha/beta fold hydrolase [Acidobacteriota bacterium]